MLQESSKLADRSGTFKTHATSPESRHFPHSTSFGLSPKVDDPVRMLVDIEDRLGLAPIEPHHRG